VTIGFGEPFSGGNLVEMADSAAAPAFESFEELKEVIETEPTVVSTALLIQAVQSRLQRPSSYAGATDTEIDQSCKAHHTTYVRLFGPIALQDFIDGARAERDQHMYLQHALVRLEARLDAAASTTNREDWQARLRRCTPDDPVPSPVVVNELPDAIKLLFSDAAAFEREHAPQVGGNSAEPMREMLGITLGMLVTRYDVDPRRLADYVRETLRFSYPESFK
jgi:hypothetical protein